jgi:hypothetical protein
MSLTMCENDRDYLVRRAHVEAQQAKRAACTEAALAHAALSVAYRKRLDTTDHHGLAAHV